MKKTFRICLWLNAIVLIFRILIPAKELAAYSKFIWDWNQKKPNAIVHIVKKEPENHVAFNMPFYINPDQRLMIWYTDPLYRNDTTTLHAGDLMFFTESHAQTPAAPPGFRLKREYEYYPSWILRNNTNDWQSRTRIWSLYQLESCDDAIK
jgi:hypothetical protein